MSKPHLDPRIIELMDACRPDSGDVAEPEMTALEDLLDQDPYAREVFSRLQSLDRSIGKAFRDVPTPPGLAARLLTAVGADDELGQLVSSEELAQSDQTARASTDPVMPATRAIRKHSPHLSRRRWIVLASSLVASVVVAVYAAVVLTQHDGPVSHYTVADQAIAWLFEAQQGDWDRTNKPPTDSYPLASSVNISTGPQAIDQWQFIGTDYGKAAVYDLTPPGEKFVYLFAVHTGADFSAPQLLPTQPARNTQGFCIGVAYRDGVLHVLIVDGDEARYGQFIRERLPVI